MKKICCLFITLIVLSANAHAFQAQIEIFEQFDNFKMVAFIDIDEINNSPEWNPDLDLLPLTVDQALLAVKEYNKASKTKLSVKEIELRPVPKYEKHWHYLVKVSNNTMKSKFSIYVVLMNGIVIPAIIKPQAYK